MDIMSKFMEEVQDYKEYKAMCREAKDRDKDYLSFHMERIAEDEWTHACWLHDYLKDHGMMSEDGEEMWREIADD